MLAVAGGGQNLECVKLLMGAKADMSLKDAYGNSLLHIAAIYQNNEALEYLIKNSRDLNVFERNTKGDTPLSIVQEKKDERALKLLQGYAQNYGDKTKEKTDELLNDLIEAEQKEEQKKAKKKDKKKRQKIR